MRENEANACATYLKALGDPVRLRILNELRDGGKTVSAIADKLGTEVQRASHHLRLMFHAGVVTTSKSGRNVVYSLNPEFYQRAKKKGDTDSLDFECCRFEL